MARRNFPLVLRYDLPSTHRCGEPESKLDPLSNDSERIGHHARGGSDPGEQRDE